MSVVTALLDRDGVINKENGFIKSKSEFKFLPQVLETLRYLNNLNIRIIIITNQSAVGRGIISSKKLKNIHKYMCDIIKKNGGKIEKFIIALTILQLVLVILKSIVLIVNQIQE